MKYIAHRGLMFGPDKNKENRPETVDAALREGFDVEVDLWYYGRSWWLGHDESQYAIDFSFLVKRKKNLWVHAKSEKTFVELNNMNSTLNYFWHNVDSYTFTSKGIAWIYPGKPLAYNGVCVLPENTYDLASLPAEVYSVRGICSDHVVRIRDSHVVHVRNSPILL
jgi:hypothetical protein